MLQPNSEILLLLPSRDEIDLYSRVFKQMGYKHLTAFESAEKALDTALKKQFEMFVLRVEMPGMGAPVFVQKLRESMNYGLEIQFIVGDRMDEKVMNIMMEYNIGYVLMKPFTPDRICQKLVHIAKEEASLSAFEKKFREVKSAVMTGMVDMAREMGNALLKEAPTSEKLLVLLGDIELKSEHPVEARALFESALSHNPKSAAAAHKLAQTYMLEKNFARAAEMMNQLTKLNPLNISLLLNAGFSNMEIGELEKAKECLADVKKLDQSNKAASAVMAQVHLKEGDYDALGETLSQTHTEKELVQFLNNAGVKLSRNDDVAGAIRMYQSCLSLLKTNEYTHAILYNMGLGYTRLRNFAEARRCFQESLRLKPDYEKATLALSNLDKESGTGG